MTEDVFIPELHDIGKLIDWINTGQDIKGHTFENVDWKKLGIQEPSNKTWHGITDHHGKKGNIDIFLLKLADQMASGISRAFSKEEKNRIEILMEDQRIKKSHKTVLKLWNQQQKVIELFSSKEEINKIIDFITTVNSEKMYLEGEFFHNKLLLKPEDEMPPLNITSLYVHSMLVGKLYRFFKPMVKEKDGLFYFGEELGNIPDDRKNCDIQKNIRNAYKNWYIKLVYCKIETPNYLSRIKDLNIFEILKEESEKLSKLNNVILRTSDQFLAFLPSEKSINDVIKPFLDKGFIVSVEEAHTNLGDAYPTPRGIKAKKLQSLLKLKINDNLDKQFPSYLKYLKLEPVLEKTICEICQLAPALPDKWVDEELEENICKTCWDIRKFKEDSPAPKIEEWYLKEAQSKVAWVKIYLDINFLNDILNGLFKDYTEKHIKNSDLKSDLKYDLRFSVLAEFQQDYNSFLKNFNKNLEEYFKTENVQPILNDFLCIKLDRTSQIKDILKKYNELFMDYFPKLKEQKSPVTLSISVSNVKFAFFRHWKILENPKNDVNVALIGRGEMHLTLSQLEDLIKLEIPASKQLHKLAKISETSEKLAKVLVYDRGDYRVYNALEPIRAQDKKIDFKTILTYAKIIEEAE